MKLRVQHPKVHLRKDRKGTYWFFRYRHDALLPEGSVKTCRNFHIVGPSRGEGALSKREAEAERDQILAQLNAAPSRSEAAVLAKEPPENGAILFGKLAEMWEKDFVEREVGGRSLVAASTRQKYRNHLHNHILPRWANTRIAEFRAKDVLDWLHEECVSWHMMADLRNIMSGIFTKSQEWAD